MQQSEEILLKENKERFVILPINYPKIWEQYKRHEASFWTAEEIDLHDDMKDWIKLNVGAAMGMLWAFDSLYVSGQGPHRADGTTPGGFPQQARQALENVRAVVEAAVMGAGAWGTALAQVSAVL